MSESIPFAYEHIKGFLSPIQLVLIEKLKNRAMTRNELVKQLKTPRTTIYDNLLKLKQRKLVEKFAKNEGKRGRPVVFWRLKLKLIN